MWLKLIRIFLICMVLLNNKSSVKAVGLLSQGANAISHAVADRISPHEDLRHFISGHDIKFPCQSTKNIYVSSGRYEPANIIATRLQVGREHAYFAIPRLKAGVPFTLARISLRKTGCTTPMEPYPCWGIQEEANCESLQSIIDLVLDSQDVLWVLDSGIVNTLQMPIRRCRPKVLAIDTRSNRVIRRIDLHDVVSADSRLQHILVDYDDNGFSYVFVSDSGAGAILVHDCLNKRNHRVVLPVACVPDQKDVLYMVMARKKDSCPFVYFTYLRSNRLFYIKSEHLRRGSGSGSVVDVAKKPKAALILLGTDNGSGVFLRFRGDGDIYRWNSNTCFKEDNLKLVQSGGDCRLSTQVAPGSRRFMWTIESNFQDYVNKECGCYGASMSIRPLIGCDDD